MPVLSDATGLRIRAGVAGGRKAKSLFFWLRPQSSDNSYRWLHPAQEPQRLVEEQLELELFSSMQPSYSQFLTSINSAYLKKNIKKKC